jgi:hypothetical protein
LKLDAEAEKLEKNDNPELKELFDTYNVIPFTKSRMN